MNPSELQRYHPERYRQSRPFAKRVASLYRNLVGENPPNHQLIEQYSNTIFNSYNTEISKYPVEQRPSDTRYLMREPSLATYYGAYNAFGRNCFHLMDSIVQEFLNTEVDEVPLSAVNFPYEVLYISFGALSNLVLYNSFVVDGAYVIAHKGFPLQIALTTVNKPEPIIGKKSWAFVPDRYYYLALKTENPEACFGDLIEEAVKNELEAQKDIGKIPDSGIYEVEGKRIGITNKRPESSKLDQAEIVSGEKVFRESLRLVVNALCYFSQYPEGIEEIWPPSAPTALIEKIEKPKSPKQAQKAKSQLVSMGYSKIKFCGRALSRELPSGRLGGELSTHWRRGHWRLQPHGKSGSKRKLVWIRPTIVRKDKGEPEYGHIYSVES